MKIGSPNFFANQRAKVYALSSLFCTFLRITCRGLIGNQRRSLVFESELLASTTGRACVTPEVGKVAKRSLVKV